MHSAPARPPSSAARRSARRRFPRGRCRTRSKRTRSPASCAAGAGTARPGWTRFEREYAALTGTAHCLATANGTSALLTALAVLDVGPGDEVIVPPYTFVATINVVLQRLALPVFVDSDIETFQIDARRIEAAITPEARS